jgi:transcription elongation factor GreA
MSNVTYLTRDGFDKLKAEIYQLETIERPRISKQIAEARDKGDLSENAEYDAAKEAQGMLEMKISELNAILRSARLVDESKIDTSSVQMMNTVHLRNLKTNALLQYTIVPEREADFKKMKISVETPIAKGLMGHKKGATVTVNVPAGKLQFEILDITFE